MIIYFQKITFNRFFIKKSVFVSIILSKVLFFNSCGAEGNLYEKLNPKNTKVTQDLKINHKNKSADTINNLNDFYDTDKTQNNQDNTNLVDKSNQNLITDLLQSWSLSCDKFQELFSNILKMHLDFSSKKAINDKFISNWRKDFVLLNDKTFHLISGTDLNHQISTISNTSNKHNDKFDCAFIKNYYLDSNYSINDFNRIKFLDSDFYKNIKKHLKIGNNNLNNLDDNHKNIISGAYITLNNWQKSFFNTLKEFDKTNIKNTNYVLSYEENEQVESVKFLDSDLSFIIKENKIFVDNAYKKNSESINLTRLVTGDEILSITASQSKHLFETNSKDAIYKLLEKLAGAEEGDKNHYQITVLRNNLNFDENNTAQELNKQNKIIEIEFDQTHYKALSDVEIDLIDLIDQSTGEKINIGLIKIPHLYNKTVNYKDNNSKKNKKTDLTNNIMWHLYQLAEKKDAKAIVIDLTNNSYGSFDQAIKLYKRLALNYKNPFSLFYNSISKSNNIIPNNQTLSFPFTDKKLIILVNRYTKKASELLVELLSPSDQVIVVGTEKTYGNTTVLDKIYYDDLIFNTQNTYQIPTARYYRSDGHSFHCYGCQIDIMMDSSISNSKLASYTLKNCQDSDKQLTAIDYSDKIDENKQKNLLLSNLKNNHLMRSVIFNKNKDFYQSFQKDQIISEASMIAADFYKLSNQVKASGFYALSGNKSDTTSKENNQSNQNVTANHLQSHQNRHHQRINNTFISSVFASDSNLTTTSGYDLVFKQFVDKDEKIAGYKIQICKIDSSFNKDPDSLYQSCTDAFSSNQSEPFILKSEIIYDYAYSNLKEDQKQMVDNLSINLEQQRLFVNAFGVGLISGAIAGVSSINFSVLAGITGITLFDSIKDASAGVPAKVDEKIGISRVALLTTSGTLAGTAVSIGSIFGIAKILSKFPNMFVNRAAALLAFAAGIKITFFTDVEQLVKSVKKENHPMSEFSHFLWKNNSYPLAQNLQELFNSYPINFTDINMLKLAMQSLKDLILKNNWASNDQLARLCIDLDQCFSY